MDALKPDLIITFSDVQADAAKELLRRGHTVLATNQRSLEQIFDTILLIGRTIGREKPAEQLATRMRKEIFARRPRLTTKPRIYFEEWNDPLISGIRWVGELIEAAGGEDIFAELRTRSRASDRVVSSDEIIRRQPDIIIASWCGKKANLDEIRSPSRLGCHSRGSPKPPARNKIRLRHSSARPQPLEGLSPVVPNRRAIMT